MNQNSVPLQEIAESEEATYLKLPVKEITTLSYINKSEISENGTMMKIAYKYILY